MKEFKKILKMTEKELKHYTYMELNKLYKQNVECTDEFVFAKGDIPVMLVAHLDTVHRTTPQTILFDSNQRLMWSPQGIGGDDRCGIYSILSIVKKGLRPYVLFTTGEEVGGVGAIAFTKKYPELPTKLKYLIELDRRGKEDCVFYDCGNEDFIKYVESFGFKEADGSFSDISILSPQYDVASVNLSIGYYSEHSYLETINVGHMFATMYKVIKMLKQAKKCEYYDYQEDVSWFNYGYNYLNKQAETMNFNTNRSQPTYTQKELEELFEDEFITVK